MWQVQYNIPVCLYATIVVIVPSFLILTHVASSTITSQHMARLLTVHAQLDLLMDYASDYASIIIVSFHRLSYYYARI